MSNCIPCEEFPRLYTEKYQIPLDVAHASSLTNSHMYIQHVPHVNESVKVLLNPNFNKKVFVNPNFNGTIGNNSQMLTSVPKIHVNPNVHKLKLVTDLSDGKNLGKIHVNPNILRNIPISTNIVGVGKPRSENGTENAVCGKPENCKVISTRTKLVNSVPKSITETKIRKRRSSVKSQFKIIRSSSLKKPIVTESEIISNRRLIEAHPRAHHYYQQYLKDTKPEINKFKLDNRKMRTDGYQKNKKYVYVNRFLSISDIARNNLLKQSKNKSYTVNVETAVKKSVNNLKKTTNPYKKTNDLKKTQVSPISKSKYKFLRKSTNNSVGHNNSLNNSVKLSKLSRIRRTSIKSALKLKICNIPCPYYRKFGRCKGKENGKCNRKHDPDQIALCTKFLQGACIDKKCFLSHNVSPEKMPTCKFYLEGSCSRDDCPYLHVRISPKADICRDFLEGFCKKAAKCNKRHQFLCPDYEKSGNCLKQRCPYPHGKMVRKYSEFNNKFAKKSSNRTNEIDNSDKKLMPADHKKPKIINSEGSEVNIKSRYYIGQNNLDIEEINKVNQSNCNDTVIDQENSVKSRPKLGKLPSYIAFDSS